MIKYEFLSKMRQPYTTDAMYNVPSVSISNFPWKDDYPYEPYSEASVILFCDGIGVLLRSDEHPIRQEVAQQGGPVHLDSCLEFFVNFMPESSTDYLNFEFNPRGILNLGIGPVGNGRKKITLANPVPDFKILTESSPKGWQVSFCIPHTFIKNYYNSYEPDNGIQALGNFYKCGDKTTHPHFGCWSLIEAVKPNFHLSEFFAPIISL